MEEYLTGNIEEKNIVHPTPTVNKERKIKLSYAVAKRIFDICSASVALVVFLPVFAVIAYKIKKEDHGPVFYKHERIGKNGKVIDIYKFRSMKVNADQLEDMLTQEQLEQYHREFKLNNDPRITKIGEKLRTSSLDELPQLVNIIKGDLSVVGPRPVLEEELEYYGENKDKFLSLKPGLTGYWQAYARNNATYESGKRQEMEMYYADHASVFLDIKILFRTVKVVKAKEGAQ